MATGTVVPGSTFVLPQDPGFVTIDQTNGHAVVTLPATDQLLDVDLVTGVMTVIFTFAIPGTGPFGITFAP